MNVEAHHEAPARPLPRKPPRRRATASDVRTAVFSFSGHAPDHRRVIEQAIAERDECRDLVRHASDVLGRDLRAGSDDARDVQVGVFLATHLHMTMLEQRGLVAEHSLGMSLGEYNHLVHIGALAFEDALRIVEARGKLFEEACIGRMVSIAPLPSRVIERAITALQLEHRVAIGIYLARGHHVLSGDAAAIDELVRSLGARHRFRSNVVEPRMALHESRLSMIGCRLSAILDTFPFATPRRPYVPNVRGAIYEPGSVDASLVRRCLALQTYRPVRWCSSKEAIIAAVPDAFFVGVGPQP